MVASFPLHHHCIITTSSLHHHGPPVSYRCLPTQMGVNRDLLEKNNQLLSAMEVLLAQDMLQRTIGCSFIVVIHTRAPLTPSSILCSFVEVRVHVCACVCACVFVSVSACIHPYARSHRKNDGHAASGAVLTAGGGCVGCRVPRSSRRGCR